MPTYEYRCAKCGHKLEVFQSMNDAPLAKCPHCGKKSLKRLMGLGAGIIFKGSGFYETDYKRPPAKPAGAAEKPAKPAAPAPAAAPTVAAK